MALTPFLAQFGGKIGQMLEKSDMKALQVRMSCLPWFFVPARSLRACIPPLDRSPLAPLPVQPKEGEMSGMSGHVIICGFGRVGELIGEMLSERLIPFVALDVSAGRVQVRSSMGRCLTNNLVLVHQSFLTFSCARMSALPAVGGQEAGSARVLWGCREPRSPARCRSGERGLRGGSPPNMPTLCL